MDVRRDAAHTHQRTHSFCAAQSSRKQKTVLRVQTRAPIEDARRLVAQIIERLFSRHNRFWFNRVCSTHPEVRKRQGSCPLPLQLLQATIDVAPSHWSSTMPSPPVSAWEQIRGVLSLRLTGTNSSPLASMAGWVPGNEGIRLGM